MSQILDHAVCADWRGKRKEKPGVTAQIDRQARLPIYQQVTLSLQQRIAHREWEIGERLPNEHALAAHYGVSRVTVRQALAELEHDGIVRRNRPSGTFVERMPDKLAPTVSVLVDVLQSLSEQGHATGIKTLSVDLIEIEDHDVHRFLATSKDERFIEYSRLITVSATPLAWARTVFADSRFPNLATLPIINNSVQDTIREHFGITFSRAEHWVEAATADAATATILSIGCGRPILGMDSVFYDQDNQPTAYMATRWLADQMRLHLESTSPTPLIDPPHTADSP